MSLSPEQFYFKNGLYQKAAFTEENFQDLFTLIFSPGRLDLYCQKCQKETTFDFHPIREKKTPSEPFSSGEIYTFSDFKAQFNFDYFSNGKKFSMVYKCTREPYSNHSVYFQMVIEDNSIMKIGQYPSIADLSKDETKAYENILPKEYRREFGRAVGLFAHGIGIGSFVYMRRIFERLIYDTHKEYGKEIIDEKEFNSLRMNEKIDALKDFLPKTLVEKRALYSILSKGIHSLDEDTCKEFFPVVKAGIEFILDEKIAQIAKKAREDKFNQDFKELLEKSK